jgi:GABA(A) receptor-associated protein
LEKLEKNKYLVPKNIIMSQLIKIVKKRGQISPQKGIFCFIDSVIPSQNDTVEQLYDKYKESCGFLYITIRSENVFGFFNIKETKYI